MSTEEVNSTSGNQSGLLLALVRMPLSSDDITPRCSRINGIATPDSPLSDEFYRSTSASRRGRSRVPRLAGSLLLLATCTSTEPPHCPNHPNLILR